MSNADEDQNLAALESEADRKRAQLSETVDDIKDKIVKTTSPSAVKREVQEYVQRSSEQIIDRLVRSANENPLQAAIVAVGVGYPLWRVCSRIARDHPAAFVSAAALTGYSLVRYFSRPASARTRSRGDLYSSSAYRRATIPERTAPASSVRIVPADDNRA